MASTTPISLAIDIYDLGVAVMTAWFDVVVARGANLHDTARTVKQLVWLRNDDQRGSPLAAALQRIAFDAADQYGDAVVASAPEELQAAWLARGAAPADTLRNAPPAGGARAPALAPSHPRLRYA